MGVEVSLEMDINELGGMINENASTGVQIVILSFPRDEKRWPLVEQTKWSIEICCPGWRWSW
jgi:hypothetical protein